MVFFADLSDSVESLLQDGYKSLGAFSVSSKTKTTGGIKLNLSAKKKNGADAVTGGVKFSSSCNKDDITFDYNSQITGAGIIKEDVTIGGVADGLKFRFDVVVPQDKETDIAPLEDAKKEEKKDRNSVKGGVTYSNDKVGANLSATWKQLNPVKLAFDIAGQVHDNVALGASVSAPLKKDVKDCKKFDCNFGVLVSSDDVNVSVELSECGTETKLGLVHKACDKLTLGAELTRTGKTLFPWCYKKCNKDDEAEKEEEEKKEENTEEENTEEENTEEKKECATKAEYGLTVGFQYKCCEDTSFSGKLNQDGVASLAYDFEVKQNLRANIATETTVSKFGEGAKFGLSLTYSS